MYKVYDNILPKNIVNNVENILTSNNFPWFLSSKTVYRPDSFDESKINQNINFKDRCSFKHSFTLGEPPNKFSMYYELAHNLLNNIVNIIGNKNYFLLRARANYTYPLASNEAKVPLLPHTDRQYNHIVILYYVIDSDGDTIFLDNSNNIINRISPVKGRFIVFNGNITHSNYFPEFHDKRIVINYNVLMKYDFK